MTDLETKAAASLRVAQETTTPEVILRVERAALEAARRFRDLVQDIKGAIIWEAAAAGLQFTFVGNSAVDILGYPVEEWLTDPNFWMRHLHPGDREAIISARAEAATRAQDHELVYRMVGVNGRSVWFRDRVTVVSDASGQPQQLRGLMLDITESKLAEEALRSSEEKFSKAFHSSPAAMSIVRAADRVFVDVNDSFLKMMGYRRDDVVGQSVAGLALWADANDRTEMQRILEEQGMVRALEVQLRNSSGEARSVIGSAEIIEVGGETCVLSLVYDVTERNQADEQLRQSEEKYRSIFENAVFGVFQTTRQGRFISANTALARILGYDSAEELMSTISDIAGQIHVDPDRRAEFAALLEENGEVHGFECRARRRDGGVVWLSLSARVRQEDSGEVGYEGIVEDITARKSTEEWLRQSDERFRRIFEYSNDAAFVVDPQRDRILDVNSKACTMLGYSREELLSLSMSAMHPDQMSKMMAFTGSVMQQGHGFSDGLTYRTSSGQVLQTEISASLLDIDGRPCMVALVRDITERKRSEQKFRGAVEAAPNAVVMVDQQGRIVLVNSQTEKLFGYSRDQLVGQPVELLMPQRFCGRHPGYRGEFFREPVARPMGAGRDLYGLDSEGLEIPLEIGISPLVTDEGTFVLASIIDISERKRSEEMLSRARNEAERHLVQEQTLTRVAELLRLNPDLQTICEAALESVMEVSGSEFGILAIKRGDEPQIVATRSVLDSAFTPFDEITPRSQTLLARALFKGGSAFSPLKRIPPGNAKFIRQASIKRFAVVPLVASGAIVGALEFGGRAGNRWAVDERRFMRRLADHVAVAISNALAFEELATAFKVRDEGVRAVSHEIKTPLTSLKGFAQLGLRHLERDPPQLSRAIDALQEIDTASDRLTRLANQMLQTSSIEAALSKLRKQRLSFGPFLRDAVSEFMSEDHPCPVQIGRPTRVWLRFDPQLIRQVLWNLLGNAVKHSPPGEPVSVLAVLESEQVLVSVIDQGSGVPKRERPRLFDKFYRGGSGSSRGLGLGLYLAKQIIEAHGGTIWYQPTDPRGATFCFSLPISGGR